MFIFAQLIEASVYARLQGMTQMRRRFKHTMIH